MDEHTQALEQHRLYRGPITGGDSSDDDLDPDKVLEDALKDKLEDDKPDSKPEPKPEPKPAPRKPAAQGEDEALSLAWSIATDYVKESCPDLDDDLLQIVRAAAGTSPVAFKEKAKQLQAKMTARKTQAGGDEERRKQELVEKVFGGSGPGGDLTQQKPPVSPSTEDRLKDAVAKGDQRGIVQSIADTIKEKKVFERGVTLVVD